MGNIPFIKKILLLALTVPHFVGATNVDPSVLDACPGYRATNVKTTDTSLTADLLLAGKACNVFGTDISTLSLTVVYETTNRIHLKIVDKSNPRYEVPDEILPRPDSSHPVHSHSAAIQFNFTTSPFSFSIFRTSTKEVLFSTATHPIIFEPQYLRVKTALPDNPNVYGLGEHTNPFHLPTDNITLTLWSYDAPGVGAGMNLYGNHPVYFEHRNTGTHGVFLLNSNGMDIKITKSGSGNALEYNAIGGVLDFYFLAGSETDPTEVARQYAEVVGRPAEVPFWSFGLHQCRFGYKDFVDVAGVISKYAAAGIPLETMWTDIDYMFKRRIFTVDPDYFPLPRMREIVSHLHSNNQRYVLMTDPAVAFLPDEDYPPYSRGKQQDVWLKAANGSDYLSIVWPGVTVYPDWFHPNTQGYWNNEFAEFYSPETGIDIDGAWIDMNEPSNFCRQPCDDPFQQAKDQNLPPPRANPPPDPNTPIFTDTNAKRVVKRDDVLNPPYAINDAAGALSSGTASTDSVHANGLIEYNVHNLFGTMMSTTTRGALLNRRPGKKTLVITRSTFAGAGSHVGKWLGDNLSRWDYYRVSIAGMLGFASIYQVPMVGSDICGFSENTTENLCARWAMLGAFYPFMRNHNSDASISQEFYIWPVVTQAAKNVLDIRYRLLDYFYTTFHQAHLDGTPVLNPMWYIYPKDEATYPIDLQFFFGNAILVSPVTQEDSTSVTFYLPNDIFYDFVTLAPVQGTGSNVVLNNVSFTQIPVHIRGGVILPLRAQSAMTTTALRSNDFEIVVATGKDGKASGNLYMDDGESISPATSTSLHMTFGNGKFDLQGSFGFKTGVQTSRVRFLGVTQEPKGAIVNGKHINNSAITYNSSTKVLDIAIGLPLNSNISVELI